MTTTAAEPKKKKSGRLICGQKINVMEREGDYSHIRRARFVAYSSPGMVKVSYDDGGLDVVDRILVEKIGE